MREAHALAGINQTLMAICYMFFLDNQKGEFSAGVYEAWREKFLLRAKLAMKDALAALEKYAPQFIG